MSIINFIISTMKIHKCSHESSHYLSPSIHDRSQTIMNIHNS